MAVNNLGRGVLGRGIRPEDIPAILAASMAGHGPAHPLPEHPDAQGRVNNIPAGGGDRDLGDLNRAQPTGSLADPPPQSLLGPHGGAAYLLGQGLHAGRVGGMGGQGGLGGRAVNSPFKRYAVNRGGKLLEAHDYGNNDVKYFARKNPAVLQQAVQQSLAPGSGPAPGQAAPGLSPQDEELLKLLLGNPSLSR